MSRTISYRQTKNMDVEIIRADLCRDMFDKIEESDKTDFMESYREYETLSRKVGY